MGENWIEELGYLETLGDYGYGNYLILVMVSELYTHIKNSKICSCYMLDFNKSVKVNSSAR